MIKKIYVLVALILSIQAQHISAHIFDTLARGVHHTAKWGFVATPLLTVPASACWAYYVQKTYPDLRDSLGDVHTDLVQTSYPASPELTKITTDVVDYIQQEAGRLLKADPKTVLVKDIKGAGMMHTPLQHHGTTYHIINMGSGDATLNSVEDFCRYLQHGESTAAPFFLRHEIAHGVYNHGPKKAQLFFGSVVGAYVACCYAVMNRRLLGITPTSSRGSVIGKAALIMTLPYVVYTIQNTLGNMYSRSCEWQADNFAIAHTNDPGILLKAAEALERHHDAMQRAHVIDPSHPSSLERAAHVRKAADAVKRAI